MSSPNEITEGWNLSLDDNDAPCHLQKYTIFSYLEGDGSELKWKPLRTEEDKDQDDISITPPPSIPYGLHYLVKPSVYTAETYCNSLIDWIEYAIIKYTTNYHILLTSLEYLLIDGNENFSREFKGRGCRGLLLIVFSHPNSQTCPCIGDCMRYQNLSDDFRRELNFAFIPLLRL